MRKYNENAMFVRLFRITTRVTPRRSNLEKGGFYTRLRQLASTCEFTDPDGEIRSQIIQRCASTKLRETALRDDSITLAKLLEHARALENSAQQALQMEKTLTTTEQNLAALNVTEDAVNSRQYSRNESRSHNSNRPDSNRRDRRRSSFETKPPDNRYAFPRQTNSACRQTDNMSTAKCYNCGNSWPHVNAPCPAKGKQCKNCNRPGHFAKVCRSTRRRSSPRRHARKHVRNVDYPRSPSTSSSESDGYLYSVQNEPSKPTETLKIHRVTLPQAKIKINNVNFPFMIDTGASINVMDENAFSKLQSHTVRNDIKLKQPRTKIYTYGSTTPLNVLGTFTTVVESHRRITFAMFYVVKAGNGSLLSCKTAQELDLIRLNVSSIDTKVNKYPSKAQSTPQHIKSTLPSITYLPKCLNTTNSPKTHDLVSRYQHLFQGVGKMRDVEITLHIDPNVPPVAQPERRIPFHLRNKVADELKRLEQNDIIEDATGPTPWVSPIVAAPKPKNPNEVRVCVDMRFPNQAIRRERHPSPTVDYIIHSLNGAKKFSKLDLRSGYHQLVLAPESRHITTFTTHKGLKRYKRLNFGTSSAAEIFQHTIQKALEGIDGILNISDDIIIFGKTTAEHDKALETTFQRLSERGLTLSPEKCVFDKEHLDFFRYTFGPADMTPDPKKVQAIKDATPPSNMLRTAQFSWHR